MKRIPAVIAALCISIGAMVALDVTAASATPTAQAQVVDQSSDHGVVVNFGACMSSIDPSMKPFLAPGKSGNGPLTIVVTAHGTFLLLPNAFPGGGGCTHAQVQVVQLM